MTQIALTANAALSLTKDELGKLQNRLIQAGVKVIEYDLMRVVNFDRQSPFYNLIDLTAKKSAEKIGYKTMVKIARQWYSGKNLGVYQIVENLYPDIKGKRAEAKNNRIRRWQDSGDWGDFFIAFWSEVHSFYAKKPSHDRGHTLWEVGKSNLMIAVVLAVLQDMFLTNLADQDEDFFKPIGEDAKSELLSKCRERCKKVLPWFPPEFFGMAWGMKSLNTGAGRAHLGRCFEQLKKTKGKFVYANSTLVTGQTD